MKAYEIYSDINNQVIQGKDCHLGWSSAQWPCDKYWYPLTGLF